VLAVVVFIARPDAVLRPESAEGAGKPAEASPSLPLVIDDRRQQLIGVRTAKASRDTIEATLRTVGTIRYDETRITDVNLKLDGWVRELRVNYTGQPVILGQPLLSLYSPDLIAAQIQFLGALRSRDQSSADQRDYAHGLLDTPRQRLLRWDVPADQLRVLEDTREVLPSILFRSPASGVVIEKSVLNGMHVMAGQSLYKIADLSVVWVDAEFQESDVSQLQVGAPADVALQAWPGEHFSGRLVHVYATVAEDTRRIRARIALQNRRGRLKPGMFCTVEVKGPSRQGIVVPADAVIDSGQRQLVFVAHGNGYFEPRTVAIRARAGDRALIASGLHVGEEIATRATFFLDSESKMRPALQNYVGTAGPALSQKPAALIDPVLEVNPDPPRTGENTITVRLRGADGRAVTDADIQLQLSMPAMPSMNMPAMNSETRLTHVRDGVYTGSAQLLMAGRWDVTLTARRHGESLVMKQAALIAR
jgi:Cu(I)/Ag(I) efflux system membrane fusion protein/cobalt-zinc-cadmium efflux system membrane fusion protein